MIERHWVFRANFTRGQDRVTNCKKSLFNFHLESSFHFLPLLFFFFFLSFTHPLTFHFCPVFFPLHIVLTYFSIHVRRLDPLQACHQHVVSFVWTVPFTTLMFLSAIKCTHRMILILFISTVSSFSAAAISKLFAYFHLLISAVLKPVVHVYKPCISSLIFFFNLFLFFFPTYFCCFFSLEASVVFVSSFCILSAPAPYSNFSSSPHLTFK